MKILHLIYNLSPGGAERFVVDLCNEEKRQGHGVTILCVQDLSVGNRSHYKREIKNGIELISLNCKKGLTLQSLIRIAHEIRVSDSEIVHAHTFPLLLYLPALFSGKKIVWTIHSVVPFYVSTLFAKSLTRLFFFCKKIYPVTISGICHDSYLKVYGKQTDTLINNGRSPVEITALFSSVVDEVNSLKRFDDTPVFVHVARFSEEKNQDLLFSAFKQLYADGIDFCLIVIGSEYPEGVKAEAEKCPGIHILGPKGNVGDYLKNSQYFVLSSKFEGCPISLLEAMSVGCIPVSTPAGGVVSVIADGNSGFLSPSHSSDDFARTLKRALNDQMVTPQRVIFDYQNNYTMELCAKKYLSLYKEIIDANETHSLHRIM